MVDQNVSHNLSRYAKEMSAVLPTDIRLTDQLQIGFMDHRGSLQRVVLPLLTQVMIGKIAQLLVNKWQERVQGHLIAFPHVR
jgi:hypothetical protein